MADNELESTHADMRTTGAPTRVVVTNDEVGWVLRADLDEGRAELNYRIDADHLVLIHIHVPAELEGHGVGSALVRAAIELAIERHLTVVPRCPFARSWLERHPDAGDQVRVDWREGQTR
jgi:uncharacterized protein